MMRVVVRQKGGPATECAYCGYSLPGIEGQACPECGSERRPVRRRSLGGTVAFVVALSVAATALSPVANRLGPQSVSQTYMGLAFLDRVDQTMVSFTGSADGWRFPPSEEQPRLEPSRIRFEHQSIRLDVERDFVGDEWWDVRSRSATDATGVASGLGLPGLEPVIAELLTESWLPGSKIYTLRPTLATPVGAPVAVMVSQRSRIVESSVPVIGLIGVTWVLAGLRIWSLLR